MLRSTLFKSTTHHSRPNSSENSMGNGERAEAAKKAAEKRAETVKFLAEKAGETQKMDIKRWDAMVRRYTVLTLSDVQISVSIAFVNHILKAFIRSRRYGVEDRRPSQSNAISRVHKQSTETFPF